MSTSPAELEEEVKKAFIRVLGPVEGQRQADEFRSFLLQKQQRLEREAQDPSSAPEAEEGMDEHRPHPMSKEEEETELKMEVEEVGMGAAAAGETTYHSGPSAEIVLTTTALAFMEEKESSAWMVTAEGIVILPPSFSAPQHSADQRPGTSGFPGDGKRRRTKDSTCSSRTTRNDETRMNDASKQPDSRSSDSHTPPALKRKTPAEGEASSSGQKRPRPETPQREVYRLLAEKILSPTRQQNCCLTIDGRTWDKILSLCESKTVLCLPKGTFSFPQGYRFRLPPSGLNLWGADGDANSTILCFHPNDNGGNPNNATQPQCILQANYKLTLKNLSLRCEPPSSFSNFWWPSLKLEGSGCYLHNINFINCKLEIDSRSNVVQDCNFFGPFSGPTEYKSKFYKRTSAIILRSQWGGNKIRNIFVQGMHRGVHRLQLQYSLFPEREKPDNISSITCRNVKIGICLENCRGQVVKDVRYEWNATNRLNRQGKNPENPAAVELLGGEGNQVMGILGTGRKLNWLGFAVRRLDRRNYGFPTARGNSIKYVKGANGRYLDLGMNTEIAEVEGTVESRPAFF